MHAHADGCCCKHLPIAAFEWHTRLYRLGHIQAADVYADGANWPAAGALFYCQHCTAHVFQVTRKVAGARSEGKGCASAACGVEGHHCVC